jgi:hypothetical protein
MMKMPMRMHSALLEFLEDGRKDVVFQLRVDHCRSSAAKAWMRTIVAGKSSNGVWVQRVEARAVW